MKKICSYITRYMALIVLVVAACSFIWPSVTGVIKTSWVTPLLGAVMFGMGLTLDFKDFKAIVLRPKDVLIGFLCQFSIMPLLAVGLSRLFHLPTELALGVILVGCCPGGTSSNVITYLSKGDVALSVGMTGLSTLMAPFLTPILVKLFAGTYVPVDTLGMFMSIIQVIIVPIALGLIIKSIFPTLAKAISEYLPAFSTIVITMIVAAVVSANSASLHTCGLLVVAVVMLHNLCGYGLGYIVGKLLKLGSAKCTAISIEVGMQNSGLACSLAAKHFAALSMASVPGAVFSVWHNISGALISRLFMRINKHK